MAVADARLQCPVAVVLPVRNEGASIDEVLARVRAQSLDDLDIIVVDGGSTDDTRSIVSRHAHDDHRVRLIENPRKLQSAGLNVALQESSAPIVARLDGHSFVDPDYLDRCVRVLEHTGADVVGGRMVAVTTSNPTARSIALTNGRWWGAGPARFHREGEPGEADTVYLGCFRRDALERAGGWAEDVGVNEDFELNTRIRQTGGRVWFDPSLVVGYAPRSTFRALARQYFRYGWSKATMLRRHPSSVKVRQLVPASLAVVALVGLLPGPFRRAARAVLAAHFVVVTVSSAREHEPVAVRARAVVAALIMHWSWTFGFWFGAIRRFPAAGST